MFPRRRRRASRAGLRLAVATAVPVLLLAGCGWLDAGPQPSAGPSVPADAPLYVSLGDSYAAGYQPDGHGGGSTTRDGFAYQVADAAAGDVPGLVLANFGCAGVTSTTLVDDPGCASAALAPGGPGYPDQPQAQAALALLRQHTGPVRLVTVVIGGNDLQPCLTESEPQACVEERLPVLRRNLDALLTSVRAAVGTSVPVVGLTYPDVYLGLELKGDATSQETVRRARQLFSSYLNPTLAQVYAAHGARFVDVTRLTGGYGSLDDTEQLAPYGRIPTPVAQVCRLTWFCSQGDVHPNRDGYALIAKAVLEAAGS